MDNNLPVDEVGFDFDGVSVILEGVGKHAFLLVDIAEIRVRLR